MQSFLRDWSQPCSVNSLQSSGEEFEPVLEVELENVLSLSSYSSSCIAKSTKENLVLFWIWTSGMSGIDVKSTWIWCGVLEKGLKFAVWDWTGVFGAESSCSTSSSSKLLKLFAGFILRTSMYFSPRNFDKNGFYLHEHEHTRYLDSAMVMSAWSMASLSFFSFPSVNFYKQAKWGNVPHLHPFPLFFRTLIRRKRILQLARIEFCHDS